MFNRPVRVQLPVPYHPLEFLHLLEVGVVFLFFDFVGQLVDVLHRFTADALRGLQLVHRQLVDRFELVL